MKIEPKPDISTEQLDREAARAEQYGMTRAEYINRRLGHPHPKSHAVGQSTRVGLVAQLTQDNPATSLVERVSGVPAGAGLVERLKKITSE